MLNAGKNKYAEDQLNYTFSQVINLILCSYDKIIEKEHIEYTKINNKYWVVLNNRKEKPEEYIRNVLLDKQYMQSRVYKRKFEVSDLEFLPEVGEGKARSIVGSHDIRVSGVSQKIFGEADEDIYFSIECKRLNNAGQNPQKYVTDGIKRFVIGKYSEKMPIAGMIGFIEDNNIDYSTSMNKVLEQNKTIETEQYLISDKKQPSKFVSVHKKHKNNQKIELNHLLLDFEKIITKID